MKIYKLSNKFDDDGCIIKPSSEKSIFDLNKKKIVSIFKKKGVIIFKGFKINKSNVTKFTDIFTKQYANDAIRRNNRFKDKNLHDVDPGNYEMPLHSEASYSTSWPEIVWFYCNKAPKKSGQTTLCDGRAIYKNFNLDLKNFFLKNQILYDIIIPFKDNKASPKINKKTKNLRPWHIEHPGIYDCYINLKDNYLKYKLKKYALIKTRESNKIAFVNHLQIILNRDPQVLNITLENNKKISKKIMNQIKKISDELTVQLNWKTEELCMIDNHRFMHGRKKIIKNETRDIINIQTLRANLD